MPSTIQVDRLSTIAGALVNVSDILVGSTFSGSDGAAKIGYGSTTVAAALDALNVVTPTLETSNVVESFLVAGELTYDNAIQLALAAAHSNGLPIMMLSGTHTFAAPVELVVQTKGVYIFGAGGDRTRWHFPNAAAGQTQLTIRGNADWYDFKLIGMTFVSSHAGTLCRISSPTIEDPLNVGLFVDLAFLNGYASTNAVALDLGYVVNSNFIGVRANCYADGLGTNYGRALVCRQVQFCAFGSCSFGNARYGVSFMREAGGTRGHSKGTTFNAVDIENIGFGVYCESTDTRLITFVGGQYSLWTDYVVQAPLSGSSNCAIEIINGNFENRSDWSQVVVDPNNGQGVRIRGSELEMITPAMPGSGVTLRNTTGMFADIYIWGGTVTLLSIDGYNTFLSGGYVRLAPWHTISLSYTATPDWVWRKAD